MVRETGRERTGKQWRRKNVERRIRREMRSWVRRMRNMKGKERGERGMERRISRIKGGVLGDIVCTGAITPG